MKELIVCAGAILVAILKGLPLARVSVLTRNSAHDSTLIAAGVAHVHHANTSDSEVCTHAK